MEKKLIDYESRQLNPPLSIALRTSGYLVGAASIVLSIVTWRVIWEHYTYGPSFGGGGANVVIVMIGSPLGIAGLAIFLKDKRCKFVALAVLIESLSVGIRLFQSFQ